MPDNKATQAAERNLAITHTKIRAIADRTRRPGHDSEVRIRFVDPATLKPVPRTAGELIEFPREALILRCAAKFGVSKQVIANRGYSRLQMAALILSDKTWDQVKADERAAIQKDREVTRARRYANRPTKDPRGSRRQLEDMRREERLAKEDRLEEQILEVLRECSNQGISGAALARQFGITNTMAHTRLKRLVVKELAHMRGLHSHKKYYIGSQNSEPEASSEETSFRSE